MIVGGVGRKAGDRRFRVMAELPMVRLGPEVDTNV